MTLYGHYIGYSTLTLITYDLSFPFQIFFEDRCDYFKKMIANYFKEGTPTNGNLPLITVNDVAPETFGQLVLYFYTDEIHVGYHSITTWNPFITKLLSN